MMRPLSQHIQVTPPSVLRLAALVALGIYLANLTGEALARARHDAAVGAAVYQMENEK